MPLYRIFQREAGEKEYAGGQVVQSRAEVVETIQRAKHFDVIVVGGGIYGAAFAHLAAFNSLKTLLLEKADYAGGASGGPLKLLAGFPQLWSWPSPADLGAMRASQELFSAARHLVRPVDCCVLQGGMSRAARLRLRAVCTVNAFITHRRARSMAAEAIAIIGKEPAVLYADGTVNGARLVLENILAARHEGAQCLNYAQLTSYAMLAKGGVIAGWTDLLSGEKHEIRGGIIVNCAGGEAPLVGRLNRGPLAAGFSGSDSICGLFDRPWQGPVLIRPLDEECACMISPCMDRTMVVLQKGSHGSRHAEAAPDGDLSGELSGRLAEYPEFKEAARGRLYRIWRNSEALALDPRSGKPVRRSGRGCWNYHAGMLSMLGGDYASAAWAAWHGLQEVYRIVGVSGRVVPLRGRMLPGSGLPEGIEEFCRIAADAGVPHAAVARAVERWGARVRFLLGSPASLEVLSGPVLRGEVELAVKAEQAESMEDLVCRRLQLDCLPGLNVQAMDQIAAWAQADRPSRDLKMEGQELLRKLAGTPVLLSEK